MVWAAALLALILVAVAAGVLARPVDALAKLYGSQFHLRGLALDPGRLRAVGRGGSGLAGFLACCNAAYPQHRPDIVNFFNRLQTM